MHEEEDYSFRKHYLDNDDVPAIIHVVSYEDTDPGDIRFIVEAHLARILGLDEIDDRPIIFVRL